MGAYYRMIERRNAAKLSQPPPPHLIIPEPCIGEQDYEDRSDNYPTSCDSATGTDISVSDDSILSERAVPPSKSE